MSTYRERHPKQWAQNWGVKETAPTQKRTTSEALNTSSSPTSYKSRHPEQWAKNWGVKSPKTTEVKSSGTNGMANFRQLDQASQNQKVSALTEIKHAPTLMMQAIDNWHNQPIQKQSKSQVLDNAINNRITSSRQHEQGLNRSFQIAKSMPEQTAPKIQGQTPVINKPATIKQYNPTVLEKVEDIGKGILGGAKEAIEYGAQGIEKGLMIPQIATHIARKSGIENAESSDLVKSASEAEHPIVAEISETVGSLVPYVMTSPIGSATKKAITLGISKSLPKMAGTTGEKLIAGSVAAAAHLGATTAAQETARAALTPNEFQKYDKNGNPIQMNTGEIAKEVGKRTLESAGTGAVFGLAGETVSPWAKKVASKMLKLDPESIANGTIKPTALQRAAISGAGGAATGTMVGAVSAAEHYLSNPDQFDKLKESKEAGKQVLFFAGLDAILGLLHAKAGTNFEMNNEGQRVYKPNDYEFISGTRNPAEEGYREFKPGSGIWISGNDNSRLYEIDHIDNSGNPVYKKDIWKDQVLGKKAATAPAVEPTSQASTESQQEGNIKALPLFIDSVHQRTAENLTPELKTQVAQSIENSMSQGMNEEAATHKAINELADTPEGAEIISNATQQVVAELQNEMQQKIENNTVSNPGSNKQRIRTAVSIRDLLNPPKEEAGNIYEQKTQAENQSQTAKLVMTNAVTPENQKGATIGQAEGNMTESIINSEATEQKALKNYPDLTKEENSQEAKGKTINNLQKYAKNLVDKENVKSVILVGSTVTKSKGNDIDLLYDFGERNLPADSDEASAKIESIIENMDMDIDSYDTFIKSGDRYFHIQNGAGREVVENTEYAKDQADKPIIVLSEKEEVKPVEETKQEPVQNNSEFTITKTKHTKTGADLWVVKPAKELSRDEFLAFQSRMKKLGSSKWSRFTKGFNFYEDPTDKLMSKAETKAENSKQATETNSFKLGRAGKSELKKWAANEQVNVDLSSEEGKKSEKFFTRYYKSGYNGERIIDIPQAERNIDFPPFLETIAMDAGKKDAEKQANLHNLQSGRDGKIDKNSELQSSTNIPESGVNLEQEKPSKEGKNVEKPNKEILEPGHDEGTGHDGRLPSGTNVNSVSGTGNEGTGLPGENGGPVAGETSVQHSEERTLGTTANMQNTHTEVSGNKGQKGKGNGSNVSQNGQSERNGTTSERDTAGSAGLPGEAAEEAKGGSLKEKTEDKQKIAYQNFRINEDNPVFVKGGKKTRFKTNIEALKTLDKILSEDRDPTIEEQRKLALYSGWGALSEAFDYDYNRSTGELAPARNNWAKEAEEVKKLLNEIQDKHFSGEYNYRGGLYENAKASTMNAHFTHPDIIASMYEALEQMGYKRGKLLESSLGTGNFFGTIPDSLASKTKLFGVELDPLTGKIAQLLYPNADIRIQGFQEALYPDNLFDVAVSNVPFGNYKINDKNYPKFLTERIHNYFFARTIDKVKPGGIISFITSTGTLDANGNERVRQYLSQKANLIGAIRLPGDAFKENAGTEVTTDIIFLQKLKDGELPNDTQWTKTVDIEIEGENYSLNQYYKDHPEMVLGDLVPDKLYNSRIGVKSNRDDIAQALSETIEKHLPKNIFNTKGTKQVEEISQENSEMVQELLEGGITLKDGKLYRRIGDNAVQIKENATQTKHAIQIRDLVKEVLTMQRDPNVAESDLEEKRKQMKSLYDSYVKKYGNFLKTDIRKGKLYGRSHIEKLLGYKREVKNSKGKIISVFTTEPETYLLKSLEIEIDGTDKDGNITQSFKPSLILTERTYRISEPVNKVNNAQDGLIASINELGYVDMDRIVEMYGKPESEVIAELGDKIFYNPIGGWETADDYLSGNVKKKLKEAQEQLEFDPQYQRNVDALSKIIPEDIPFADITVKLGDGWVPFEITEKVVRHILGFSQTYRNENAIKLEYSPFDNTWNLSKGSSYRSTAEMSSIEAGTGKKALAIVKTALNNSDTVVKYKDHDGKTHVDQEATNALRTKVKELRDYLKDYLATDLDAMNQVEEIYNEKFNNTVPRDYAKEAEMFTFPNMNPEIKLRPHQKNAIIRALLGGNSLLAHGVGAGKTYEQIAIAMEGKRLGLFNKPLLVVPNTKLTDFDSDAKTLYPGAKILALGEDDFDGNSIKRTLALAALNDWDMVIVRHSSFSKIPVSPETEIPALQAEIQELEEILMESSGESKYTVKNLEKRLEKLRLKLDNYQQSRVKYEGLMYFEDMGFDMLIVDEAHEFKNYPLYGSAAQIKGLVSGDADKARDMMIKSNYIRKINGGNRGIVFGTGTPISNSMAEIFVMFKYLRPDLLLEAGISNFDAWTDAFADITEVTERSPKGDIRNKKQFKSFVNLPELITMFREFTDIKMQDELDLPLPDYEVIKVECDPHPLLGKVMAEVDANWKDAIKEHKLFRLINMIVNAPQDMRLVVPGAKDHKGSKVNKIADNVKKIYKQTSKEKGTQLIFTTIGGSNLTGFNLWDEMKKQLIARGIPANEIAFIKTGTKEDELEEIYRKINSGKIRIAIGTFAKMGTGINVQERLFAEHELNAPYRPSDIEQAEGRMIRQGNTYRDMGKKVQVYKYITVGENDAFSGDAFKWQIIESKVKSINAVMKGDPSVRTLDAFDAEVNDAALMKAIALGDERYIRVAELEGEVDTLRSAYNAYQTGIARANREMSNAEQKVYKNQEIISSIERALSRIAAVSENEIKEQKIILDGKEYSFADKDSKKAAEKAVRKLIKQYEKAPKKDVSGIEIAKVQGMSLMYGQKYNKGYNSIIQRLDLYMDRYHNVLDIHNQYVSLAKGSKDVLLSNVDGSILSGVIRKIKSFPDIIKKAKDENKILEQEIAKYKEMVKQPFKHEEELQSKRQELKELNEALGIGKVTEEVNNEEGMQSDDSDAPIVRSKLDTHYFMFYDNKKASRPAAPPEIQAKLDEASEISGIEMEWAPQALNEKPFKLANELAKDITGNEVITYESEDKTHGFTIDDQIYLNAQSKQPMVYITAHEITHTMETTHPEYYKQLMEIVFEHIADFEGLENHYIGKYQYEPEELPHELTADVVAECIVQPSFWQRIREKAPEILKSILDIIDRIIKWAKDQAKVPEKYEIMGYMKDIEKMRDRIADLYKDYLKDVRSGKHEGQQGQEAVAAKTKREVWENIEYPIMKPGARIYIEKGEKPLSRLNSWTEESLYGPTVLPKGTTLYHVSVYKNLKSLSPIVTAFTDNPGNLMNGHVYAIKLNKEITSDKIDEHEYRLDLGDISNDDVKINYLGTFEPDYSNYVADKYNRNVFVPSKAYFAPEYKKLSEQINKNQLTKMNHIVSEKKRLGYHIISEDEESNIEQLNQAISSANTSLSQVASTFKSKWFTPGKVNIDIGGGKYDKGTQYLKEKFDTENLVYDPFNRTEGYNRYVIDRLISGEQGDTVTVNNVLNVIAESSIRDNLIKQAAKAVKPDGKAYFLIYEGNASSKGKETTKGWQNNRKASFYMQEVGKYFENVERKGNLIIANKPQNIAGPAIWMTSEDEANNIRFKYGRPNTGKLATVDKGTRERLAKRAAKQSKLESLENQIEREVNEANPKKPINVGMQVNMVNNPKTESNKIGNNKFTFENPEFEERWQAAKGIKSPSLMQKLRDELADFKNKATREYEHLPHGKEFSEARFALLKLQKQSGITAERTLRHQQWITLGLDTDSYDLFTRKVILDDLNQDLDSYDEKGHNLPFGLTREDFEKEYERTNHYAAKSPKVAEAIEKRNRIWRELKNEYLQAMDDIGFDATEKLSRDNYYHHQVLEYMDLNRNYGTGQRLKSPVNRGFLRHREGSNLDYNTEYMQAEVEVMGQMLHDIEIARTIKTIDSDYNILDHLKSEAKSQNQTILDKFINSERKKIQDTLEKAAAEGNDDVLKLYGLNTEKINNPDFDWDSIVTPTEQTIKEFNKRMARAFSELSKMANDNKLWTGENEEWARAVKDLVGRTDFTKGNENHGANEVYRYLSALSKTEENGALQAAVILKNTSERRELIKQTLGDRYKTWEDVIPKGYTTWQPREGTAFYFANTISEQLASELFEKELQEVGLKPEDIRQVLAKGQKFKQFVIPEELAATLDNLKTNYTKNVVKELTKAWKVWTLISPRRLFKYNMRNLTGDADAVFCGNPSAFKKAPQAFNELYQVYFGDRAMTPEMREWFKRGGMQTLLQAQENINIDEISLFKHLIDARAKKDKVKELPLKIWHGYWKAARLSTDLREAILRYSAYLDYLEQIQGNSSGRPKNFGASIPDEIMALHDIRNRAFVLSNQLLGAYDQVSVIGQQLRECGFPFFSWLEVNPKRYIQLIKNAASDGKTASTVGKMFIKKSPVIAYRLGKFFIMAAGLSALLAAYNNLFFHDEEKELSEDVRTYPHIILGRNKDGSIRYFSQLGAFADFLEWFGMDTIPYDVTDYLNGRKTLKEIVTTDAKKPVNKIIQGISPFIKGPLEAFTGFTLYPDAFKPGKIRDKLEYLAQQFNLTNEYKAIRNRPSQKGFFNSLKTIFYYEADPDENAYWETMDNKNRFLKSIGKSTGGYSSGTDKSLALYYYKQALRYQDKEAADRYLTDYIKNGGTGRGLEQSIHTLRPWYGLGDDEDKFINSLTPEDKEKYKTAVKYYKDIIMYANKQITDYKKTEK